MENCEIISSIKDKLNKYFYSIENVIESKHRIDHLLLHAWRIPAIFISFLFIKFYQIHFPFPFRLN